jgi:tetratricopeptide (TPR) repeat protein
VLRRKIIIVILVVIFLAMFFLKNNIAKMAFQVGEFYFTEKHYNLFLAKDFYRVALLIDPEIHGAHYQIARVYFLGGAFDIARDEIDFEIKVNPEFKRSYYVRGLIDGYDMDFIAAISDFEEFLKWKPQSWAALNDLSWVYFQIGDYEKVLELAGKGLEFTPSNPWLLNTKGLALYNLGRKDESKIYLAEALKESKRLSPEEWKVAYPGNDPNFSSIGLNQMLKAIETNKNLAN